MNINEVLVQILKKDESEQILHRNEEDDVMLAPESISRDASHREVAEKL